MNSIPQRQLAVKASSNRPQSFCADESNKYQSIHSAEGLTAEDKRLFLGARLRLLYRKLLRNSPISREELAGLVPYADGNNADENGVPA